MLDFGSKFRESSINPVEIIIKKRDGLELSGEELRFFINSYTAGTIPDYQAAALLMAIFIRGLSPQETLTLTKSMLYSGTVIDLSDIPEQKIGKHSTGGVGDKTSLIIAPIVLAAGVKVPQISGRGLGHTGGTLDKMESIPGFNTRLDINEYKRNMKDPGALIIGQTGNIAPADKLLYALRDVVGAVPSIPLITASIMSKKLAEGTDGLVLDVKTGSGAFMKSYEDARKLAESLKGTAEGFGKKCVALLTEMSQPLGYKSGNWYEVHESIDILRGAYVEDLCEISFALSGAMIMLGGKAGSIDEGIELSRKLVASGEAFDNFVKIIEAQGGDVDTVKYPERYPVSKIRVSLTAPESGYISSINGYEIGMALVELGAGRTKKEDDINHKAGLFLKAKVGDFYNRNQEMGFIDGDDPEKVEAAYKRISGAISISSEKPDKLQYIKEIIY